MNLVLFNHHRRSTGILPPSIHLLALTNAVAAYAARLEQEEREEKRLRIHVCEAEQEPAPEPKPRILRPPIPGDLDLNHSVVALRMPDGQPSLTLTLRKIEGDRAFIQVSAHPSMRTAA